MSIKDKIKSLRKSLAKKVFDKKTRANKSLDIANAKSILFLRNDDKIGDMVISTILFREVKKAYPGIKVLVLCGKNNAEIIKNNPYVDEIIKVTGNICMDFKKLIAIKPDVAVDFFSFRPRPSHLLKLRLINPRFLIGYHKGSYNVYDFSIDKDFFSEHISKRYQYLLNVLGIEAPSLKYDIFFDEQDEISTKEQINKCDKKYKILINPFAASIHRSLSFEKLKIIIESAKNKFGFCFFILSQGNNYKKVKALESDGVFVINSRSILASSALVKNVDAVITPDTSIAHIASAFNKRSIVLYQDYSDTDEKIDLIWAPNNDNAVSLNVDTQNGKIENDINNIDNNLILDALKKILQENEK